VVGARLGLIAWWLVGACAVGGCGAGSSEPPGYTTTSNGGAPGDSGIDRENAGGSSGASGVGGARDAGRDSGAGGSAASGGTSGSAGAAGESGAGGQGGSGGACADPGPEPNDDEASASPACGAASCKLTDCDSDGSTNYGGSFAPATGVLSPGDTDFFTFQGSDTFGCEVDPTATTQEAGFRLCIFAQCNSSVTTFNSCTQGTSAASPSGLPGCCTDTAGTVDLDYHCNSGLDDSAKIYIRADRATVCTPYTIDYHF
jgi:hypothetical protein